MSLLRHHGVALFNNVVNDVESYSLVLKVNKRVNLINLIPGLRLLISSLPGSASRMHVESLGKPRDSTTVFVALPGNLISKDSHLLLSVYKPTKVMTSH